MPVDSGGPFIDFGTHSLLTIKKIHIACTQVTFSVSVINQLTTPLIINLSVLTRQLAIHCKILTYYLCQHRRVICRDDSLREFLGVVWLTDWLLGLCVLAIIIITISVIKYSKRTIADSRCYFLNENCYNHHNITFTWPTVCRPFFYVFSAVCLRTFRIQYFVLSTDGSLS